MYMYSLTMSMVAPFPHLMQTLMFSIERRLQYQRFVILDHSPGFITLLIPF